jgi:hypothetical protein
LSPQRISENRRVQYLQAMGIDAWISRDRAKAEAIVGSSVPESEPLASLQLPGLNAGPSTQEIRYEIGPGSGQTLVLCASREQAASPLASDIARCLDEVPVWGWQEKPVGPEGAAQAGLSLQSAIEDRLFTRVLLFCNLPAEPSGQAQVIGSALVIRAPALPELANNPQQKRALWMQLVQHGWCAGGR